MKNIPKIRKDLKKFLISEEGKIVEKDAIELGLALVAVSGILSGVMSAKDVLAASWPGSCGATPPVCAAPACHASHSSHASHASHASHGSHGAHGRGGGWC